MLTMFGFVAFFLFVLTMYGFVALFFLLFFWRFKRKGHDLHKPNVIGSATEGALVILAAEWGFNATTVKEVRNL